MSATEDPKDPVRRVMIDLPGDAHVVGASLRPGRMFTLGRRRSDRAVAYALCVFLLVCSVFPLYVGWMITEHTNQVARSLRACPAFVSPTTTTEGDHP